MKPVRYGMIGGGQGAFIGGIHRTAAAIAGNWQLVAGAFSSTAEKARASRAEIGVDPAHTYGSWAEMLEREAALPADVRIEAVSIVTPNHMHAPPAIAAIAGGLNVIIDKLSTHVQCQLVALQPAYDALFDDFADSGADMSVVREALGLS